LPKAHISKAMLLLWSCLFAAYWQKAEGWGCSLSWNAPLLNIVNTEYIHLRPAQSRGPLPPAEDKQPVSPIEHNTPNHIKLQPIPPPKKNPPQTTGADFKKTTIEFLYLAACPPPAESLSRS
jgi:hypothetical protein